MSNNLKDQPYFKEVTDKLKEGQTITVPDISMEIVRIIEQECGYLAHIEPAANPVETTCPVETACFIDWPLNFNMWLSNDPVLPRI